MAFPLILSILAVLLIPSYAFAQQSFADIVGKLVDLIQAIIPVVGGLILLAFMWGVARYVFSRSDSTSKLEAKQIIVWGLVGLFVAFSLWGIVTVLKNTFL